jgi:glucosyl-3-phosphoglycerate synthase
VVSAIVVIPARDEQRRISACLEALARQTVGTAAFEAIVVVDCCADATAAATRAAAARHGLCLRLLAGPGRGAGAARKAGMDAAAKRLLELGRPDGLIATTDADSRPAPDWLARQLAHVARGAQAIAGASLGLTAGVYREVGGLEPVVALEDARFEERLHAHGIPVLRPPDVRVRPAARVDSRASRGLGVDLAVAGWIESRRYAASEFTLERLRRAKGSTAIAVIVPTKSCAETIAGVLERTVGPLAAAGLVDELAVVDAGSEDGTAAVASRAGARVLQQDELLDEHGPALGKGDAMWRALSATGGDVVCFLDGDTANPDPLHLQGLLGPLLSDPALQLVKGAFDRPLRAGAVELPHEGGRVTELMARPLLNLYVPRLAGFAQPLAGEFAARRALLEAIPFPVGYGVEIAILIDALRTCGLDALAECQLGVRRNRHQPLRDLGEMAYAVLTAVERRLGERVGVGARAGGAANAGEPTDCGTPALGGHYLRPWDDGAVVQVPVGERPPLASLAAAAAP